MKQTITLDPCTECKNNTYTPDNKGKLRCTKCNTLRKFKVNALYDIAIKYIRTVTDETEIAKINMTNIFFHEIDQQILLGELVRANINAKVRTGKSTLGTVIALYIHQRMKARTNLIQSKTHEH